MSFIHQPVLLQQTLSWLNLQPGDTVLDCTLGGGGHTRAIWERLEGNVRLIAIDQDEQAISHAKQTLPAEITLAHDNFRNLRTVLLSLGVARVDKILFDLGVSSPQLDQGERGFSYNVDAPLDMRMDQRQHETAYHLVNRLSAEQLAQILWDYGEERWSKRIAEFIVQEREQKGSIRTTGELVAVIKRAIPAAARQGGPHPAKRTFQALRIALNGELQILKPAIEEAVEVLRPGGRVAMITFHSLEDRIVKQTFREIERGCTCPPNLPVCVCGRQSKLKVLTRKPVLPSAEEISSNPRARSAKLRVAERLDSSSKRGR
ncbi:MAG: 16S rRNA (cytosine(1402)-N(4))-methyltransferase RsmH [Bacillota bacterium]